MDDQRVSFEHAVTSVRMIAPIQGGHTESGYLLRVVHRTEAQDHKQATHRGFRIDRNHGGRSVEGS
jgi:hypothetical protein